MYVQGYLQGSENGRVVTIEMRQEFEAERKQLAIYSFLCHSSAFSYTKLRSNRNQAQALRFVFNPRIIMII
jgi:hypothetical protein